MRKENEQALRERIAYIHGRIECEIEAFANSLNIPPMELAQWMGALFLGLRPGDGNSLSDLSASRNHLETGESRPVVATLESALEPHGDFAQRERGPAPSVSAHKADAREVKQQTSAGKAIKSYWAKMSPLQRKREMARRQSLWSKKALTKWGGKRAVKKTAKATPKKATAKKAAPVQEAAA